MTIKTTVTTTLGIIGIALTTHADVTFSDSEFSDADWELVVLTHQAGGTTSGAHSESGGCAGAYRSVITRVNDAAPLTTSGIIGFHRKIGAVYSPSTQGAIAHLDYSECAAVFDGFGDGQATGPALRQGGKVYVHYLTTGVGPWHTIQARNLTATNFVLVSSTSPTNPYDSTQHPDFSASGATIEFGFWRGNFTSVGSSGYRITGGIDNWSVTVRSIGVSSPLEIRIRCTKAEQPCGEVEICWNARSNRVYQVQYCSDLTTNLWTDLLPPIPGDSGTNCVTDKILVGQEQRFYRVVELP